MLQFWEGDPRTDVVLLYLESFGNPRKFTRLARRLSRRKPIIAVKAAGATPHPLTSGRRGRPRLAGRRHHRRAAGAVRRDPGRHAHRAVRRGQGHRRPARAGRPSHRHRQQLARLEQPDARRLLRRRPRPAEPVDLTFVAGPESYGTGRRRGAGRSRGRRAPRRLRAAGQRAPSRGRRRHRPGRRGRLAGRQPAGAGGGHLPRRGHRRAAGQRCGAHPAVRVPQRRGPGAGPHGRLRRLAGRAGGLAARARPRRRSTRPGRW